MARSLEVGVDKTRRKEAGEGRYFVLGTRFGRLRMYPPGRCCRDASVGSFVPVDCRSAHRRLGIWHFREVCG